MRWWRSCYISMFACSHGKIFFDGMDQENSKTQEGKGQSWKISKKTRRKEWRKEKEEIYFLITWRFPYSCVLHRSGTPSGLCPCVTLPQERTHWYGNLPYNMYTTPSPWLQCQGGTGGMESLLLDRVNSRVRIGCSLLILPLK